jgi:hypothetical protein
MLLPGRGAFAALSTQQQIATSMKVICQRVEDCYGKEIVQRPNTQLPCVRNNLQ